MPFIPEAIRSKLLFGRPGDIVNNFGDRASPTIFYHIDAVQGGHGFEEGKKECIRIGSFLWGDIFFVENIVEQSG